MPLLNSLSRLVQDPPPAHVFELSEAGIAYARRAGKEPETGFEQFPRGALNASPVQDNVLQPDVAASILSRLLPPNGAKRRRPAAVLLPDSAVRIAVLDFDSFPSAPEEQLSLVRFRVRKTIPFDIESAVVSYYVQAGSGRNAKIEVVAVTAALEVLARYEALFRSAGFHPGEIGISALSALNLYRGEEPAVIAKKAGKCLTVMVVAGGKLKLFRCLGLEEGGEDEILGVLHPTFAYAEDELGSAVRKLILCGFERVPSGLRCEAEPFRSRYGAPGAFNAGLLGYLEAA